MLKLARYSVSHFVKESIGVWPKNRALPFMIFKCCIWHIFQCHQQKIPFSLKRTSFFTCPISFSVACFPFFFVWIQENLAQKEVGQYLLSKQTCPGCIDNFFTHYYRVNPTKTDPHFPYPTWQQHLIRNTRCQQCQKEDIFWSKTRAI